MSFDRSIVERAIPGAELTLAEAAILRAMLVFADGEGCCSLPVGTIAAHAHASGRTTQRSLRTLEREGWITPLVDPAPNGARVYRLTAPLAPRSPEARRV